MDNPKPYNQANTESSSSSSSLTQEPRGTSEGMMALVAKIRKRQQEYEPSARFGVPCQCDARWHADELREWADELEGILKSATEGQVRASAGPPNGLAQLEQFRPDAHKHMPVSESYRLLADLFVDIQASHSLLSRRGKVLGNRLPERIALLCDRADAGERERQAMAAIRSLLTNTPSSPVSLSGDASASAAEPSGGVDRRGFKAVCIRCRKPFYIPWETMCDAGICDDCMRAINAARLSP